MTTRNYLKNTKKYLKLLPIFFLATLILSSCNRETTVDRVLFKESRNKIYKDLDEAKLSETIQAELESEASSLVKGNLISNYYKQNGYQPTLIKRFFPKENLHILAEKLASAADHGLIPSFFKEEEYRSLLSHAYSKDGVKTLDEAYESIARLELATAEALVNYTSTLQFGAINPNKVFERYYIETKQADSAFVSNILSSNDIKNLLDSIQPSSERYVTLQKALKSNVAVENKNQDEVNKTIMVNLERERWKQDFDRENMIYVNIPAFRLDVIKNSKPELSMKVVVGTGRNRTGEATFTDGSKPLKDSPHSHETPVLESLIHSVQVNPVWNIPASIAGKEILKHAQRDRFYLSNAGIDVLQDGQVIEDPENIDWNSISPESLPYRFRQRPGDENALGKIKFLFKNNSSVYLHDTPAQAAFDRETRALSHGCVRVAEPLILAKSLFGEGDKFNVIKRDMESDTQRDAKDIALSPKTQVVLDYRTIEVNNGKLMFHPDVYGLDIVLHSHLMQ